MAKQDTKIRPDDGIDATVCPNCDNVMPEEVMFCSSCGQKRIISTGLGSFMGEFLQDYFTFDSKIFRSLRPLLFRPGWLVQEYLAGRRVRYIPPLRIFIFTSILFFLLFGFGVDNSQEALADELDLFFSDILPKLIFLFLPLFALLLQVFFGKKGGGYTRHFLFSTYLHSFIFVVGALYWCLSKAFQSLDLVRFNRIWLSLALLWILLYLWFGLRRVHGYHIGPQSLRFLGLTLSYLLLLVLASMLGMALLLGLS